MLGVACFYFFPFLELAAQQIAKDLLSNTVFYLLFFFFSKLVYHLFCQFDILFLHVWESSLKPSSHTCCLDSCKQRDSYLTLEMIETELNLIQSLFSFFQLLPQMARTTSEVDILREKTLFQNYANISMGRSGIY